MHLWSVSVSIHDKLMHSIRRAPQHPTLLVGEEVEILIHYMHFDTNTFFTICSS